MVIVSNVNLWTLDQVKVKKNEKTTLTLCQPPILLMLLVCTKMLSTQGVNF